MNPYQLSKDNVRTTGTKHLNGGIVNIKALNWLSSLVGHTDVQHWRPYRPWSGSLLLLLQSFNEMVPRVMVLILIKEDGRMNIWSVSGSMLLMIQPSCYNVSLETIKNWREINKTSHTKVFSLSGCARIRFNRVFITSTPLQDLIIRKVGSGLALLGLYLHHRLHTQHAGP